MKRLLPVIIVLCLLGAVFTCLPKTSVSERSVSTLEDVNNCSVGIQGGSGYEVYLAEVCPDAKAVFFNEFSSIYPALQQGKIDVMITESIAFAVEKLEIPSLIALEEPIATLDYSIGIAQNAQGRTVYQQLNEFTAKLRADGTLDAMQGYWFDSYDRDNATVDKSGITGENGVLPVAMEAAFEPMCFAGKGGELFGYNIDYIYRFCREYGYKPEISTLDYDAMTAALSGGKITMAVGVIPDEERSEAVLFTDPILDFEIIVAYDSGETTAESFFVKLGASIHKTFIRDSRWQMFVQGAATTLLIAVLSVLFGTVLGLLLYLWCMHGGRAEQKVTNILCWLMSSTPTIVLLMILYYIVFGSYVISNIAVAVVGFSLLFGCGFYERIGSGVKAVGVGQEEAARSQGFSQNQTFFLIQLPQAAEHFMPSYQGDVISLIQETSVVGYIAVMDLTKMSDLVRGRTYEAFFPLLATAGIYFLLIWLMTLLLKYISSAFNTKNRKPERILNDIAKAKKEDER